MGEIRPEEDSINGGVMNDSDFGRGKKTVLVSVNRGSKRLGVCEAHTRRQIKAGLWPSYSLGPKALRIDVEEIRDLSRNEATK